MTTTKKAPLGGELGFTNGVQFVYLPNISRLRKFIVFADGSYCIIPYLGSGRSRRSFGLCIEKWIGSRRLEHFRHTTPLLSRRDTGAGMCATSIMACIVQLDHLGAVFGRDGEALLPLCDYERA